MHSFLKKRAAESVIALYGNKLKNPPHFQETSITAIIASLNAKLASRLS